MARLTKEKYDERREQIIKEGMFLFLAQGYHATGIKQIAETCGIHKGSFFNFFASKEEFACEAVKYGGAFMGGMYKKILTNEGLSPIKRIKALYTFRIDILVNQFQFKKGCILNGMSQEMADQSDEIADRVEEELNGIYDQIEAVIKLAMAKNEIKEKRNARDLAIMIENSYRGAMVVSKSLRTDKALKIFMKSLHSDLLR